MILLVRCATCNKDVASVSTGDMRIADTLMLAAHTASEHSKDHSLVLSVDGLPPPDGEHSLLVECLADGCNAVPRSLSVETPMELVTTHVLAHHSAHEGHFLRITLDGVVIHQRYTRSD